jgi:hypothetical protein
LRNDIFVDRGRGILLISPTTAWQVDINEGGAMIRTAAWKFFAAAMALMMIMAMGAGVITPGRVQAATPIYVNATTGSDTYNGESATVGTFPVGPKLTIQAGIDVVTAGGIVHVAAGNYVEQVGIYKSLTLTGPSASAPYAVIVAPLVRANFTGVYDFIVEASGVNARLENLVINANNTILSAGFGLTSYAGVLLSDVSGAGAGLYNCSILGFNSTDRSTEGVAIYGTSTPTIDNCEILSFRRYGIYSSGTVINLTVSNCDIRGGSGGNGIRVSGGTAVVNHNYIFGGNPGISSALTNSLTIIDNEILNQTDFGIYCESSNGAGPVTIVHNLIHGINLDSSGYGIYNNGGVANGSIVNNEIYGCKTAINLDWALSTWSVTNNWLYHCAFSGVRSICPLTVFSQNLISGCVTGIDVQSSLLTAHCNAILGNTTAGLTLAQNGAFDVTNNYWGANSGPNMDGTGPGSGDKIITNGHTVLTYKPWIVQNLTASPATLVAGSGASTITMDLTKNSAGAATGCVIPILVNAVFTTNLGSFSGATTVTTPLVDLRASAALSSGAAGTATVTGCVVKPGAVGQTENISTQVVFTAPAPINPLVGTGAPTSHGSSVIGPATSTPPVLLPSVQAQSATLSAKTVMPGTPVTVTADVTNKSAVNGNKKVTLYVNGQVETTQGVNVNSGGSTQLTFNVSRSEPGDYSVYVDGVPAGSFKVELFNAADGILVLSAVLVALAFIVGMVMLWRRQQRTD